MPLSISDKVNEYYDRCVEYNIVGGKLARARTVCESMRFCSNGYPSVSEDQKKAAVLLGWCVEILQAFFLIEDDVMDRGETRRGRPCWYKDSEVGIANAINDGLLLEQVLYELIEQSPFTKPVSVKAHRKLRDASMRTVIGQHLDTCPPKSALEFTRDQWLSVVRFKTAFYTFHLPCELGILVSGTQFKNSDLSALRHLCLLLGELFQAQDDMLDCFGDPAVIGKIGRDIEEGKCTWLWYSALELTEDDPVTRSKLVELYTSPDRATDANITQEVKIIYKKIGIEDKFSHFQSNLRSEIDSCIASMEASELRNLGNWLLGSILGRQK
jgi:farnesyl diphosphate synthase